MIKLTNVNKYFNRHKKNQIHVINDTSLTLPKMGLVSLLGPSGCGKTTLLNAIGGLDKVSSGSIYINDLKLTRFSTAKIDEIRNLNIGYIFQDYNLIDNLTVFENVALVLKMIGIKDKKEIATRVNYILETLGLYRYRNRFTSMLSGGERQRVGIARAIVKNPNIIIADEPTGNLDSKNTLEIMNIIKAISKDKLVILVTHEKDLAHFYSSRIIELSDGKIISDKENNHTDELDYRIDNKIYLKDMKNHQELKNDNITINYYSDDNNNLDLELVVKNGNIYLKNNLKEKLEVVDKDSNIEFVNENYKKINKDEASKYEFKFNDIINTSEKLKYKSIFNPISLIINGFKKVFNYPFLKKILLGGFFVSAMFILYSVSNIMGITNIKDTKFVTQNKEYLNLTIKDKSVNNFLEYEKLDFINYILPGDSKATFLVPYNFYYQTISAVDNLSGSLADINMVKKDDLIYGKMPSKPNEIVVDIFAINNMFSSNVAKQVGIKDVEELLNQIVKIKNMNDFVIVGITDLESPSIYVDKSLFINILSNTNNQNNNKFSNGITSGTMDQIVSGEGNSIIDYELIKDKITLKEGRIPSNDYEVIVSLYNKETMPLNKEIDTKINGIKLKVVGYYIGGSDSNILLVNSNSIKYNLISKANDLVIYSKDKNKTINYFNEQKLNIGDSYTKSREEYVNSIKEKMISNIIFASIIIVVSLVEIFLMIRASFLSRIKEVGILRAIGVKKGDIYKMFLGEIVAITSIGSLSGFLVMLYAINQATNISLFKDQYLINPLVIGISLLIIYGFNIIIGLLPVFTTLRKTPAAILSRTDI